MLKALAGDAIFIASVFAEALALLSLLQSTQTIVIREELEPMLAFYHAELTPLLGLGASLVWKGGPQWFTDASVLSAILFFFFCIAQARKAMGPYGGIQDLTRIEAIIDWVLPALFCAAGAAVSGPTLLPLLTLPAALFLGAKRLAGRPVKFELSGSYHANALCLAAVLGGAFIMLR